MISAVGDAIEQCVQCLPQLLLINGLAQQRRVSQRPGEMAIQPSPQRVEADGPGHRYVVAALGDAPIEIHMAFTPRHPGHVTYSLTLNGGRPVSPSTFVWP
jgi:hypothetical protein